MGTIPIAVGVAVDIWRSNWVGGWWELRSWRSWWRNWKALAVLGDETNVAYALSVVVSRVRWTVSCANSVSPHISCFALAGIAVGFLVGSVATDRFQLTALAGRAPSPVLWAFQALAVNGIEPVQANTLVPVPGTVWFADITHTIDSVKSIDAVTSSSVPSFLSNTVSLTLCSVPVLSVRAGITLSIDHIETLKTDTRLSIEVRVLSASGTALIEFGIPLTCSAYIALPIDDVVALEALTAVTVESRVLTARGAYSTNVIESWTTDAPSG